MAPNERIQRLKRCSHCGAELPATTDYFHREKSHKDGLASHCKPCILAYHATYRARPDVAERQQAYLKIYCHTPEYRQARKARRAAVREVTPPKRRGRPPRREGKGIAPVSGETRRGMTASEAQDKRCIACGRAHATFVAEPLWLAHIQHEVRKAERHIFQRQVVTLRTNGVPWREIAVLTGKPRSMCTYAWDCAKKRREAVEQVEHVEQVEVEAEA